MSSTFFFTLNFFPSAEVIIILEKSLRHMSSLRGRPHGPRPPDALLDAVVAVFRRTPGDFRFSDVTMLVPGLYVGAVHVRRRLSLPRSLCRGG